MMKRKLASVFVLLLALVLGGCESKGEITKTSEAQIAAQDAPSAKNVLETVAGAESVVETENGAIEQADVPEETVTIYVKESMVSYNDDGSVAYQAKYEYDKQGNLIKSIRTKGDGSVIFTATYTYDAEGRETVYHEEDASGGLRSHGEYTYDENGFLEKSTWYNKKNEVMSWDEYKVDENGRKQEYFHYDSEGKLGEHQVYVWDGDRLMSIDDLNDEGIVIWRYSYQYDADGNCIQNLSANPGSTNGNRYDYYYENGLCTGWDYGNEERRSSYGKYEYTALEVSKEAAERYYKKQAENPGDV